MRVRAVLAVLLSIILITTVPANVSASSHTQLVVGSQHTTSSDFNNAAELTNLTVSGSGNAARLVFTGGGWRSDADLPTARQQVRGAVAEGNVYAMGGYDGTSTVAANDQYNPTTDTWSSATDMPNTDRLFGLTSDGSDVYLMGGISTSSALDIYDASADSWSSGASMSTDRRELAAVYYNGEVFALGGLEVGTSTVLSSGEAYDTSGNSWSSIASMPIAREEHAAAVHNGNIYVVGGKDSSGKRLGRLDVYDISANSWTTETDMPTNRSGLRAVAYKGHIYAIGGQNSGGNAVATVERYDPSTNTWESVSSMPTARYQMASGVASNRIYASGGYDGTNELVVTESFSQVGSGEYIGANHTVENAEQAFANVSLTNAHIDYRWEYHDGSAWTVGASGTWTTTANHTVSLPDVSSDTWRLNATFVNETGSTTAQLHDEGIQFTGRAPIVDNASASPTGGLNSDMQTFEIQVDDPDFPLAQGDTVTAELFIDGSSVGTDSLTSNGTASVTTSVATGGSHTYHWEFTDSYGLDSQSDTFSINVPDELRIYNESAPNQLVDSVEVSVRFFGNSTEFTVDRSTNNGIVDLSGLPANAEFVVFARADGYFDRRIYVESLYDTQRVYLLPDHAVAGATGTWSVYNVFQLDDRSGQFEPATSVLKIQRALNISGNLQYVTVSGDVFGATNAHEANLRYNRRYRLLIRNEEGDQRTIGAYLASDENNPKTVLIRQIVIRPSEGSEYVGSAWVEDANETDAEKTLYFTYSDPQNETDSLDLEIYERNNQSNVLDTVTVDDVGTQFAYTRVLTGDDRNTTWMVNWTAQRAGETVGGKQPVGGAPGLDLPMDPVWLARFGLIAIPIVAGLSSERIATYGALGTVVFAGLLMLLGWVNIHPALWWLALLIALGSHAYTVSTRGGAVA